MNESVNPVEQEEQLAERLQVFASRLSRLAHDQAARRSDIEQRWLKDLRQYHGEYQPGEYERIKQAGGSQVYVNITRNKTNAAEARLQDMLFPTDDRNWGIKPTPVPELDNVKPGQMMQGPGGEQVDAGKVADEILREAKKKALLMQQEIDDQLNEARYPTKARDIIHDAAQLGTGIVKGPVVVGRVRKRWDLMDDGTSVLQITEDLAPSIERVDIWDFYPDMSARTIDECEFIFEKRRLTKRQLRDFARMPGVLKGQLRKLLRTEAKETHVAKDYVNDIRSITGVGSVVDSNRYEIWEYHGPISKEELIDAMQDTEEPLPEKEIDELNDELEAVVFFSGQCVLKVAVNPMDTEDRPYSVFNWEKDESSIFGFGVPYLMRNPQKVINAAWRMMMDNGGMSVADQVVVNREIVRPADGSWQLGPKKLWYMQDKTRSVQEAFATFSTPSHQVELANIFSMARQLADEETNLPLIAQGEQASHVTKTSSGMAMLMNSANIVLRRAVKNWDDDITRPTITRFYDWNMQFSESPEIKGDYTIDARGSGALLVREKQQENLLVFANVTGSNPELALRRDWEGLDCEIAKALEVPYHQITLSDAEIEERKQQIAESQQQPEDPNAQIKAAELQLKQQQMQVDAQLKQQEMQYRQQLDAAKLQQERELKLADIAARENLTVAQLQAKLQLEQVKIQTQRDKAAGDLALKRTQTQMQAENLARGFDTF
ncbi:hypothetical protein [Marinobacterium sp. MBR-109]|jgi:hypothetical protein|uniref:hypothetical protein n=1 Tax=Marinobacterium sp. MBR-109 TaxID=3156462 RepID=UPI003397A146